MTTIFSKNLLEPMHIEVNLFDLFETVLYETDLCLIGFAAYQQTYFGAIYVYLVHEELPGYFTLLGGRLAVRVPSGEKKYLAGFSSKLAPHTLEHIPQF
jgi:hypothetical protein